LATGALFAIEGAKDQQYLITSTNLSVHNTGTASQALGGYESTSPNEEPVRIEVCGIRNTAVYRPTYMPKPLVMGPQTGRVVGKDGEEIDTDKYGRIRVQMHWDRDGKFNESSSCWVRVAQPWAGNRWGVVFNPRIGNEVVVEFLEGDPDRPLVTGSVYNVDNMPPYTLSDNQTQSGIKTRSSKGGTDQNFNELRFEDKKGHEELHIQAERNMSTLVKANQSTTIGANRTVNIKKDDMLVIDGSRAVKVKGVMSVTVEGEVEGGGSDLIHSTQTVTGKHKLEASDTIEICAPNKITLKVGDTSITLEPEKITLKAAGGGQIVLTTDIKADSDGGSTLQLDGKALLGGKSAATVDGGPETTVKGGSGSVKLDGGGVTVAGPTIKLNS
jgi:type VI secretion system secreted protein VgrG